MPRLNETTSWPRRDVDCPYCGTPAGKGHNLFVEHGQVLDESVEEAAREMLRFGAHEGPCVHAAPYGGCSRHRAAFERRKAALQQELGESVADQLIGKQLREG